MDARVARHKKTMVISDAVASISLLWFRAKAFAASKGPSESCLAALKHREWALLSESGGTSGNLTNNTATEQEKSISQ